MKYLAITSLTVLAFVVGMVFPDVDQKISFLVHRSVLTHGPWIAMVASLFALNGKGYYRPLIVLAFNAGMAIHLAADLFPKAWTGFALIHIPLWGRLPATASVVWILASVVILIACMALLAWKVVPSEN